jgi:hypothetical protein
MATEKKSMQEMIAEAVALAMAGMNKPATVKEPSEVVEAHMTYSTGAVFTPVPKAVKTKAVAVKTEKTVEYWTTDTLPSGKVVKQLKNKSSYLLYMQSILDAKGTLKSGSVYIRYSNYETQFMNKGDVVRNDDKCNLNTTCVMYHVNGNVITTYGIITAEMLRIVAIFS